MFIFEHQLYLHNRWLQYSVSLIRHGSLSHTNTAVHTPVTPTLREKRWASAVRGLVADPVPSPPHTLSLLPYAFCGLWFHKKPSTHTEEHRDPVWAFEPLNPTTHPSAPVLTLPGLLSFHTSVSVMNRSGSGRLHSFGLGNDRTCGAWEGDLKALIWALFLCCYEMIRRAWGAACVLSDLVSLLNMHCSL